LFISQLGESQRVHCSLGRVAKDPGFEDRLVKGNRHFPREVLGTLHGFGGESFCGGRPPLELLLFGARVLYETSLIQALLFVLVHYVGYVPTEAVGFSSR
jgi:hypothetical protein